MDDTARFQRLAALAAILSVPFAFGTAALSTAAVDGNAEAYIDASVTAFGPNGAQLFRWAMLMDVFGYYLLLAPLGLLLWRWLKPLAPDHVMLYTLCGLAYILLGSIGAVVLAAVEPPLIAEYAQASAQRREIIEVVFKAVYNAIDRGVWNPLEALLAGIWWTGIGRMLRRERPAWGLLTILLGACALLDAIGRTFTLEAVFQIGVGGIILLVPVWALWSGVDLLRRPVAIAARTSGGGTHL